MQLAKNIQAVAWLLLLVTGAGCEATKVYTGKLFPSRGPAAADSSLAKAPRFLEIEADASKDAGWVSSDRIMGRDTVHHTAALDKLSAVYPAGKPANDSSSSPKEIKPGPASGDPVARSARPGEVRTKRVRED